MKGKTKPEEAAAKKVSMTLEEFFANELPSLSEIVTFCNTLPMSIYADSTGVKSPEVVYRGLALSQNRLVSEEYLLNFRRTEADLGVVIGTNNYTLPMAVGAVVKRDHEEDDSDHIPLPPYQNLKEPFGAVVRSRRSVRKYAGKPLTLQDLSTLLFHAAGRSGHLHLAQPRETVSLGKMEHQDLRTHISGGALYPIDLCFLALRIDGLPQGAYRYLPREHAVKPLGAGRELPAVARLAQFGEIQAEKAAFLLGYVYNVFENSRKYGEAGLAFAFIEVGAIATQLHLSVTALGLGACCVGSYSKRQFESLFGADGISRHMIHLTVVGR